jgi:CHASE1-domain containing sensor protein
VGRAACDVAVLAASRTARFLFQLFDNGTTAPSANFSEYFPILYVEPVEGNIPALGLELGHRRTEGAAMIASAKFLLASASAPLPLVQYPQGSNLGVVVLLPV